MRVECGSVCRGSFIHSLVGVGETGWPEVGKKGGIKRIWPWSGCAVGKNELCVYKLIC